MELLLPGWGKDGQGTGWTGGHGRVVRSKQPRGREICSQPTQSLSSTWDLGKFEALNWGEKSNIYSGMFSGYPILLEMLCVLSHGHFLSPQAAVQLL